MKKGIVAIAVLVVALGALVIAALQDAPPEPEGSKGEAALSPSPSASPGKTSRSPGVATPTPTPSRSVTGEPTEIQLAHLTSGYVVKSGVFDSASTEPVLLNDDTVTIVHLFSCCDHATPPTVTAGDTTFDLVVTHETGEKRHWVYRAVGDGAVVPIEFDFDMSQGIAEWVVDEVTGVPTTNNGADAIGATAWQDSQMNASEGSIDLAATDGAVVGFGLIGSGRAREVTFEPGYEATSESGPGSYQIVTFWSPAPDGNLAATFVDESGTPQVMSWLFLAAELLPDR